MIKNRTAAFRGRWTAHPTLLLAQSRMNGMDIGMSPFHRSSQRGCHFLGLGLCLLFLIRLQAAAPSPGQPPPLIDFSRQIRPLLSENCFSCHGPDEGTRKAKLRLDLKDAAFKGGKSGVPAIVPGKPEESELVKRLVTHDGDELMPPAKSNKKLSEAQISLLTRWVAEGAPWQTHWAFEKPVLVPPPATKNQTWPRNDLDRFVLARLESDGLKPSPEADKTTLIRRATLDVTGLPPTVDEVDAFLNDPGDGAYDKLVDRLLSSARYGENMTRSWMDAVRYADSHGYHIDSQRDIWPYRDWVIRAFNQNMPFDQFTTEQLAGDLLPNATREQKIASGYLRCNMSTGEGGVIEAEYAAKYGFDRTETTGAVWLGLTLTCARCHTHKYDPITQREYYSLFSFFNSLNEPVMDGNRPNPDPFLRLPTAEQKTREDELKILVADGAKRIDQPVPDLDKAQEEWQRDWHRKLEAGWTPVNAASATTTRTSGTTLKVLEDQSILATGSKPAQEIYEITAPLAPGELAALRLEALPHDSLPAKGSGRAEDGRFRLLEIEAELVTPPAGGTAATTKKLKFAQAAASDAEPGQDAAQAIDGNADTGWTITTNGVTNARAAVFTLADPETVSSGTELRVRLRFDGSDARRSLGHFRIAAAREAQLARWLLPRKQEPWRVIGPFPSDGLQAGHDKTYEPETETDFAKPYRGVRDEIKWSQRTDLEDGKRHLLVHDLHGVHGVYYFQRTIHAPDARQAAFNLRADDLFKVWVNGVLVFERSTPVTSGDGSASFKAALKKGDNKVLIKVVNHQGSSFFAFTQDLGPTETLPADIAPVLAASATPVAADVGKIRHFYRREHSTEFRELFAYLDRWRGEQASLDRAIPTTMVARELDKPRETHMLMRGEYDKVGDKVGPGVPSILPPLPKNAPTNRLGLAQWLVSAENPLTPRVTVNRFWQQIFGVGLVKTAEDFGVQGERPSNPALLDWLAAEFVRSGWDIKRLQRLMLTSATYRQSSKIPSELAGRDPENRLLARGPRFRVDGEVLRDMALYTGGLLVEQRGGPSIKPYQPPGLWEAVSFNNSQKYVPDTGEAQYRRSLYIYWKRQSPPPNMLIFDAPTREYCVVRRPRTNTPLQALALLNDPQLVEAARGFAQRILLEGGGTTESRLAFAFRTATARKPGADEIEVLRQVLDQQLAEYRDRKEDTEKLLGIGSFKPKDGLPPADLAAWTTVAGMILNLDETVTKG
jgi:hypothetical protein